jgi:hypothetical protein
MNVIEKVPVPFISGELGGSTAWPSVLVKPTVPEYSGKVWPNPSTAVTVKLKEVPVLAKEVASTRNRATPSLTLIGSVVPLILELATSVAVMVWLPAVPRDTVNVPIPLTSAAEPGNPNAGSVLDKLTIPE